MLQGTKKRTPQREEDRVAAEKRRKDQQEVLKAKIAAALKIKTPAEIADAVGVSVQAVSGWKTTGKVATEFLLPLAHAIGCRADDLLTKDAPLHPTAERAPTFEGPLPTAEQAVDIVTSILIGMTPVERTAMKGPFSEWAGSPADMRAWIARNLSDAQASIKPPPAPGPKRTKRDTASQSERKSEPAKLAVIPGGGNKSQLALPLRKAVAPAKNPFDESNAPKRERDLYPNWTAPKAANK